MNKRMMTKNKTKTVITTIVLILLCGLAEAANAKPNIIVIFNDDQGYQDLGCFGSPDIGEANNVIEQYPEIAERLAKALLANPNK